MRTSCLLQARQRRVQTPPLPPPPLPLPLLHLHHHPSPSTCVRSGCARRGRQQPPSTTATVGPQASWRWAQDLLLGRDCCIACMHFMPLLCLLYWLKSLPPLLHATLPCPALQTPSASQRPCRLAPEPRHACPALLCPALQVPQCFPVAPAGLHLNHALLDLPCSALPCRSPSAS